MAPQWKHLIGGLSLIAAVCALPMASGFGAAPIATAPSHQVNRALKGDRLVEPPSSVASKNPARTIRELPREPEPGAKPKLPDGCEPLFSPVAVPSAVHLTGRCVG